MTPQMRELKEAYAQVKKAAAEHGRASQQYKDAIATQASLVIKHMRDRQKELTWR
jgi:hypothetical protein